MNPYRVRIMKNLINSLHTALKTFLMVSVLATTTTSYGDDTEVFYSVNAAKPNLLFVLDISGSMGAIVPGAATGTAGVVDREITSSRDDMYSNFNTTSTTIQLSRSNYARFRFTGINVPQGSEITDAYIQFNSVGSSSGAVDLDIHFQSVDNAPVGNTNDNFWGNRRSYGTRFAPANNWSNNQRGASQRASVKREVQNLVTRSNWNTFNAMAFYIGGGNGNGSRTVSTFDHPSFIDPTLHIEYVTDASSRIKVMQDSLRAVLDSAPDNIKVGLMNYGQTGLRLNDPEDHRQHAVSGVAFPIRDINEKARVTIPTTSDVYGLPNYPDENITVRNYIADVADSWNATSWTPIVDSLYEAALYFRGEKIHYGQTIPTAGGAHPTTYNGSVVTTDVSDTSGVGRVNATAPTYKSPIESSCQENYIVLMTDGAPTYRDSNGNAQQGPFARIRNTSNGPQGTLASAISSCNTAAGVGFQGNCGAEITEYIATNDNMPDPSQSRPDGQEGDQFIGTYTVGFAVNSNTETYLKSLATIDDGNANTQDDGYFAASDPQTLADAFRNILEEVAAPKGTLASPGYSVNVKNGLEHENDIYIPVFDRKNASRWAGNLKKFKLIDVAGKRHIRGKNGIDATNELGGFTTDAIDYWSDTSNSNPDGKIVQRGGLANKLDDPANRKVYSNLSGNAGINLYDSENAVSIANMSNLTNSVLGVASTSTPAYRERLVRFMRGRVNGDANGAPRFHMGDMLHSEPLVVTYNKGDANGIGKKQYIFAGTNEGYLHAFNTADDPAVDPDAGKEMFAFIPKELLGTISEPQYLNAGTQVDHKYGVDGALTVWFKDDGVKGVVDGNDQVIVYFGLRRGGTSFYALDVTDIDEPKLLWTKSAADYGTSMGQSWSIPYLAKVGMGSSKTPREVMIVSGGYDEAEDRDLNDGSGNVDNAQTPITGNNIGNDILVLDAKTGNLLWSLSSSDRAQISSSIPGGVRIIDTNYNGLVDRMYFADTSGDVWRLDLTEKIGDTSAPESELTKLASLGGLGVDARKFYNEPDVARMKLKGKSVFAVSVGSGFRAHPMDETIADKFFVLIDKSPYSPLVNTISDPFDTITTSDLANRTIAGTAISNPSSESIKDTGKRGWQINFTEPGEKVLGVALAFDGNIAFTTLVPEVLRTGVDIDQCAAPVTQSRFYAINLLSGGAGMDLSDNGGDPDDANDVYITTSTEILGRPQVVYNPPSITDEVDPSTGNPTGKKNCKHPVDIRTGKKLTQSTGYDACRLESVYWSDPVSGQ